MRPFPGTRAQSACARMHPSPLFGDDLTRRSISMGFLIRSAFWLGLTFHAMSWGDAQLADFVPSSAGTLAAGLAARTGDGDAASLIAHAVLRGAIQPRPAYEIKTAAPSESATKFRRASVDTLSAADRAPVWRGAPLRGTL